MTNNAHITIPYDTADLTRLTGDNRPISLIPIQEIKAVLKSSKRISPGQSAINKQILTHLPDSGLERLQQILNSSLSAGYFPEGLKEAVMVMVPKPG